MKAFSISNTYINKLVSAALAEDGVRQDITTRLLIPKNQTAQAKLIVKQKAIVCGVSIAKKVFQTLDARVRFSAHIKDGQAVKPHTIIATVKGKAQGLLRAERVALNFLSHLSGIATRTHQFVQKVRPRKVKVMDTRKTTPLLRGLERYAVQCGGGINHRFNLETMVFIKDNHRAAQPAMSLSDLIKKARNRTRKIIAAEVDNLTQFKEALASPADIILLDNMPAGRLRKAVRLKRQRKGKKSPLLEASGGINLRNVRRVAQTGVDRISIGELTHTKKAIDFSLELKRTK